MELFKQSELIVDTKQFHLSTTSSSGEVLNGDAKSYIRYNIPDGLVKDDSIVYIHFSIPYAVIPNSNYIINSTNNTLVIFINSTTTTYTFPEGNYNANLFINRFNTIVPNTFTLTLDQTNNVFSLSHATTNFSVLGTSTIDYILGFSGTINSASLNITFPRSCNFLPLPRINIRCSKLANSIMTNSSSTGTSDIILSVPNNAKLNGQIIYNNTSNMKTLFKLDNLNTFEVRLTDDLDNLIDFNGLSSFFVFQFDIYRRSYEKPLRFQNLANLANTSSYNYFFNNQ